MTTKRLLTAADYVRAADALKCDVASIRAVTDVEAPKGGFLPDDQVTILFERHVFHRETGGRWAGVVPDLSNPDPGGYKGGAAEHVRLQRAVIYDRNAALRSASWGKFQIMGFNHVRAGFATLQAFINAMSAGEPEQLDAFVTFIKSDPVMHRALQRRDWAKFAYRYNGKAYAKHGYHTRLAKAYTTHAG